MILHQNESLCIFCTCTQKSSDLCIQLPYYHFWLCYTQKSLFFPKSLISKRKGPMHYSFINSLTVDKSTLFVCLSNLSFQYFLLRNPTKYTLCLQFHVKNYQSTGCKKFNIYIFVSYPPSSCTSCFWCKVKYHSDFYCFDIVFHPNLLSWEKTTHYILLKYVLSH